MKSAASLKQCK